MRSVAIKNTEIMSTEKSSNEGKGNGVLADVIGRLSSQLNKQLEDYMIDGLKRKGFEFKNRFELENFIKSNCRCEDRTDIKQRTYFANDIPFFLHCYEIEMDLNPIQTDREFKMSANYGRYAYL